MAKTLVAYATRGGATRQSAEKITGVLRDKYGFEVDLVDLGKTRKPDISSYRNIIVGGGVRAGRIYGEALRFLGQDFGDRKVAFYISTMEIDEKQRPIAEAKYLTATLEKLPKLKPISTSLFGGKFAFLWWKGSNLDLGKVEAWTDELASRLEK